MIFLLLLSLFFSSGAAAKVTLYGSGATTVQLFLTEVTKELDSKYNVDITYNAIGSGSGREEFIKKKSQFCASDVALSSAEESRIKELKYTLPLVLQSISVFTSIPGLRSKLEFSPTLLSNIFQGKIRKWNHPQLVKLNPSLKNVKRQIYVVVRGDGSGSTALFTQYLRESSRLWNLGSGNTVKWPSYFRIGIGNTGVASTMKSTPYSIGYMGSSIGNQLGLVEAYIPNLANVYLSSSEADLYASIPRSFPASYKSWAGISLVRKPGKKTWPITSFSYLFVRKNAKGLGKSGGVLVSFLKYLMSNKGQALASKYLFIRIPSKLSAQNVASINKITLAAGVKPPF